jgi:hypothetical protein
MAFEAYLAAFDEDAHPETLDSLETEALIARSRYDDLRNQGLTSTPRSIVPPSEGVISAIPRGPTSCSWRPIRDRLGRSVCVSPRALRAQISEAFSTWLSRIDEGGTRSTSRCAAGS